MSLWASSFHIDSHTTLTENHRTSEEVLCLIMIMHFEYRTMKKTLIFDFGSSFMCKHMLLLA